jgi:type IV pilus assembly protein PilA
MKKRTKGFTLVEMIIVIAIIGVLSAVLIPSWMNYIANSRIKTQNNNAKVIFNAAQTTIQRYRYSERFSTAVDTKKVTSGEFYLYFDGSTATAYADSGTSNPKDSALATDIANEINRLYSSADTTVYRIYVKDYMVMSVVSGRSDSDRYLGSYPRTQDERNDTYRVSTFNMEDIDL